jgi:hypothetical protein
VTQGPKGRERSPGATSAGVAGRQLRARPIVASRGGRAGALTEVPCGVQELSDHEAFMQLVLGNT